MAASEYPADPPATPDTWSDIVVPCLDDRSALRCDAALSRLGVDTTKVDGRNLHVPWRGDPKFLFDLFAYAVEGGFASDVVCAAAQRHRINEIERRNRPWLT